MTINDLRKQEGEIISNTNKLDEEMGSHKQNKRFLDLIAIASKLK